MRQSILLLFAILLSTKGISQNPSWTKLLNEKDLTGWDTYLGPSYDTILNAWDHSPLGLNTDPMKVFSIVTIDGHAALRISGERFGGISTQQAFKNYHLRLEFKWGQSKSHPKKNNKRDSGLLYHAVGEHGADFGFWMRSQEFQLQEGDCGDYWGVAGGSFEVTAKGDSANYVYNPKEKLLLFNEKSPQGRHCIKNPDAEKPSGEWNVVELYCYGGTAVHVMNGKVVMVLQHSSQLDNGKLTPLQEGKIQLQSEGAEVYYRNIEIQSINKIPANLLR
jgi:hypothetical protein